MLQTKELLPGRKMLLEQLDEHFAILGKYNITNLSELLCALNLKNKLTAFSRMSGINLNYLTLLRREAQSYIARPVPLHEMPVTNGEMVERLYNMQIKNSKHLFLKAYKRKDRGHLSLNGNFNYAELNTLVHLCDLIRITGVGPIFARILFDAGIHSLSAFIGTDKILLSKTINEGMESFKVTGKISPRDIEYCLDYALYLPDVLEK